MQQPDGARRAATAALVRMHRGGFANLAAKNALAAPGLSPRGRAFAAALFYGTAERLQTLDTLLQPHLKRPLEKLDVEVRAVLETGLYQVLYMDVPARAAVDEAVKLTRGFGKASAAGFVNAVLRRAAAAGMELPAFASETERVCAVHSVGQAVARAVMAALPDEYNEFFAASFSGGRLCLRANPLKTTPEQLALALRARGAEVWPGTLPGCLYAALPGGVAHESLFEAGHYHVQGEASQYACACLDVQPGQRVLDVCAAPGGKTATLAGRLGGGRGLTACDVRENRLPLVAQTLERLGIEGAQLLLNDGATYNPALAGQDRVLCDVPCSGLGVLAAKPDIRYTDGEHFAALPALQGKILATAARYVNRGGRLVYATCTVLPQENGEVVNAFLGNTPGFRLIPPPFAPPGARTENNMVTILPHCTGLDGFFVATLERL